MNEIPTNLPEFLEYANDELKEDKDGNEVPLDPCTFTVNEIPDLKELRTFIAWHLVNTRNIAVFKGTGHDRAAVISQAAIDMMPWTYKVMTQCKTQEFEITFACVKSWIKEGKYRKWR